MAHARVGILGGGQLARMTAEAARELAVEVVVLERVGGSPAGQVVGEANEIVGDWQRLDDARSLARRVDLVTLESEFVDAELLAAIARDGTPVLPPPEAVRIVQDKLQQKERLAARGLPVAPFRGVASQPEIRGAAAELGWPLVLKARRNGYDGYGNATVAGPDEIAPAWSRLTRGSGAGAAGGLLVEQWVPFIGELAVMVARGRDGAALAYPVVETVQREHICREVIAPARAEPAVAARARDLALAAVEAVGGVGIIGVELFLTDDGRVLINELAPRPHNSGHYTIEACQTSQFANHLRAILGWPLGSADLIAPAAAMVNLLGTTAGPAAPTGVERARQLADVFVHIYGKREVRPGRKMGHITALGPTPAAALERARAAAIEIAW